MRFCISILLFCFSINTLASTPLTNDTAVFNKALIALKKNQIHKAVNLFSQYLIKNPLSQKGRFNLALSLYQQDPIQKISQAYWRQILFKNPYHVQTKNALEQSQDTKYFWLWIPPDFILTLLLISWGIFLLLKKKSVFIYLGFPCLVSVFSIYYFYQRNSDYNSLIQSTMVLSAPDPKASVLFEQKTGVVVKVLSRHQGLQNWSHIEVSPTQRGWIYSKILMPIKSTIKPPLNEKIIQ